MALGKRLYGDLSDRYLGVKNGYKSTSEFLIGPYLVSLSKSMVFRSIFGRFRVIPASFSSANVRYYVVVTYREKAFTPI